ncbi:uncharacterized protein TNCV_1199471 [Trichonephila clavipes]|uniref:Uncharacterized protein n=1 Tax=Trichonephila clavipes TaxID=2585209 RepID=A0A8X6RZQ7_TRICX|nr:uncharacterized protein TNCV_1199471 [Trichonephila clavipes]
MGRIDAAIRRSWQQWVNISRFERHDLSSRPKATADQEHRLIVRFAVTASDSSLSTIRHATRKRVSIIITYIRLIVRNLYSYSPIRHLPYTPAHG